MRTVTYYKDSEMKKPFNVEYDENAPCIICGEPVISASMGGTAICGSCDMGKCRYCGVTIFVMKESIDGGESKKRALKHMEWHHKNDADNVKKVNNGLRRMNEIFDKEKAKTQTLSKSCPNTRCKKGWVTDAITKGKYACIVCGGLGKISDN